MTARRLSFASRRAPILPALAALAAITLAGCGEPTGPAPQLITELPRELTAAELRVIEGSNAFAFGFLRELVATREGDNVFTSPLSASMAFGMAMNGAAGETWSQMRDVLGFEGLTEDEINQAYHDLIALLRGLDPSVTLGLANSMWIRQEFTPLPDFVERLETWFDAEARRVDFSDPGTVDVINGWVADATNGRIEELIESIPPEMVLYLINAVYFYGDWRNRFDADLTAPAPFTTLSGDRVTASMMEGPVASHVGYADGATIVEIPYGGTAFSAVAVLPPPEADPASWVEDLTEERWTDWLAALAPIDSGAAVVRFPEFELEWESSLNQVMQALGMTDAYDCHTGRADFSRIDPFEELCILESKQMTFVKVDEKGTEAAAATYVGIAVVSSNGPRPVITFDRPFLLAIRERLSGALLFLGVIGDPRG